MQGEQRYLKKSDGLLLCYPLNSSQSQSSGGWAYSLYRIGRETPLTTIKISVAAPSPSPLSSRSSLASPRQKPPRRRSFPFAARNLGGTTRPRPSLAFGSHFVKVDDIPPLPMKQLQFTRYDIRSRRTLSTPRLIHS